MKPAEWAAWLTGRQIGHEMTDEEEARARAAGLVVLFGASDDLAEFRGAIKAEADCYEGGTLLLLDGALYEECEGSCERHCGAALEEALKHGVRIEAVWGEEGFSWTYRTQIPHATFEILENSEPYCRGIVFKLTDAHA